MLVAVNTLMLNRRGHGHVAAYISALLRAFNRIHDPGGDGFLLYCAGGAVGKHAPDIPRRAASGPLAVDARLWERFRLPDQVFCDRADVLLCPGGAMPRLSLLPTVVSLPDVIPLATADSDAPGWIKALKRRLPATMARAKRVVVPNRAVRDELLGWNESLPAGPPRTRTFAGRLRERLGFSGDGLWRIGDLAARTAVIPWGVEDDFYNPVPDDEMHSFKKATGLDRYVLLPSLEGHDRCLVLALKTWFTVIARHRLSHKLVVLAAAPDRRLRLFGAEAAGMGVADGVGVVMGASPSLIRRYYQAADLVLIPSDRPTCNLSLARAVACGTPTLAGGIARYRPDFLAGNANAEWLSDFALRTWQEAAARLLTRPGAPPRGSGPKVRTWDRHGEELMATLREVHREDKDRAFPAAGPGEMF